MVLGHLKGPVGSCWNLPTHIVGRGGGDGGGRALPLPLPPGWGEKCRGRPLCLIDHVERPPGHLSMRLLIIFVAPALPCWMGGEEDP